jgi:hypothetical protein
MNEPTKNGCWNCANRQGLLCKVPHSNLPDTRLADSLKVIHRPLDEEQFKIPINDEEAGIFGRNSSSEGGIYGEDCDLWTKHKPFMFR